MTLSPKKINAFLYLKLPSAYLCGVRVKEICSAHCVTTVRHKWINQNPFKSIFWAVQGMAAELSTGALVMAAIEKKEKNISMLVVQNNSEFLKKATGKIRFSCLEGEKITEAIDKCVEKEEGISLWLKAIGEDEAGEVVSKFRFLWTLKMRQKL